MLAAAFYPKKTQHHEQFACDVEEKPNRTLRSRCDTFDLRLSIKGLPSKVVARIWNLVEEEPDVAVSFGGREVVRPKRIPKASDTGGRSSSVSRVRQYVRGTGGGYIYLEIRVWVLVLVWIEDRSV